MSGFAEVIHVGAAKFPASQDSLASPARDACVVDMRAVCAILFGLSALCLPILSFSWLMALFVSFLFADAMLAIGMACLASAYRPRITAALLAGGVNLVVAAGLLLLPTISVPAMARDLGMWGIVTGVLGVCAASPRRTCQGRTILLSAGVASITWGGLLCLSYAASQAALMWWLGGYTLARGGMLLVLASRLRTPPVPEMPR